jgi:HSP20 family protein
MIRPGIWRRELSAPLQTLQTELNRLYEEYFNPVTGGPASANPTDLAAPVWAPAIDLIETPNELVLVVDIPGVDPSTIDLSLTGNVLALRGEKNGGDVAQGQAHNRVKERPTGPFHRQITLTEPVDFERVQAESRNGILTVRLPKQEAARPRSIPIQPAGAR